MLFGENPWVNLVCGCAIIAGVPALFFCLLYLAWRWLWPKVLRDVRETYRYITGPDKGA